MKRDRWVLQNGVGNHMHMEIAVGANSVVQSCAAYTGGAVGSWNLKGEEIKNTIWVSFGERLCEHGLKMPISRAHVQPVHMQCSSSVMVMGT